MGNDGFLKRLDCQSRRINIIGDTNWITGTITRKYVEGEEHLVDLDLKTENQEGILIVRATATVRLLSKVMS
jgi:hypothetical protein